MAMCFNEMCADDASKRWREKTPKKTLYAYVFFVHGTVTLSQKQQQYHKILNKSLSISLMIRFVV